MQSAITSRQAKLRQSTSTVALPDWRLKPVASGALAVVLAATLVPGQGWAQLVGGRVVAGAATINQAGVNTTINQATQNAIIQYNSFNVPGGAAVRFNVPNGGATLNRVNAGNPSAIHGTISSNGAVFLINPNGILIGPTGMIDTARFVASTRDIDNAAFMAGGAMALRGGGDGTVINLGTIKASSGDVLLFGSRVENAGSISAPKGQVTLAAGDRLMLAPTPMSRIAVEGVTVAGGVSNSGVIDAAQARVLAAGGVYAMAINQSGSIKASGTLNSAGSIVIDGADVRVSGNLQATSNLAAGALVQVTGDTIALVGADVRAVNANDGGTILIGGGWQGKDPDVRNAKVVAVDSKTVLNASAADGANVVGNGGTVVTWADQRTQFAGKNFARGGAAGGNGGRVEVSGKQYLDYTGATNTLAPKGLAGELLLDPVDICITSAALCLGGAGWSRVTTAVLANDLAGGTVNITTGAGAGNGDIAIESAFNSTQTNRLNLNASRDIKIANQLVTAGRIQLTGGRDVLVESTLTGANAGSLAVGINATRDVQIGVLSDPTLVSSTTGNIDITAGRNLRLGTGPTGVGASFAQVQAQGVANLTATGSVILDSKFDLAKPVIQGGTTGGGIQVKAAKFTNNTGTSAFKLTNPTGRWFVSTVRPDDDKPGGLVPDFRQFNATLGVTQLAQNSGNGFLYSSLAPVSLVLNINNEPLRIANITIAAANVTPQNIAQQTVAIVTPRPPPPPPPVTLWSDMRFNTLAEALAYQKTPEFLKQANPNNLPACTDPVMVTCFRPTPPGYTPVFNGSTLTSQYSLGGFGASIAKFQVSASEEWVNMPAIARETVRPANAVQTGPAVTNPNTPNTGYLARELIAPDTRPKTVTGLPGELAAVEQRLMATWAVNNLSANDLANELQPRLREGIDYTLTSDKPPKLLKMLDTPNAKAALESQFRSREEIAQANGGSYRARRDGAAVASSLANNNRGEIAVALFAEAAVAFQVKPENRSKEQQELVTYMYSYMAKEAKDTYIQAKAEYTAWTLDTPQGDSNARGDGVMMLFGNVGGQHKAPPKHLMDQAVAGMNMTAAESSNFQNALAGSLSAGVSLAAGAATAAAVGAAMGTQAVALAITPFAQILASGAGEATELLVGQFLGLTGGATGGALSVAGIGVALVAAAITGVVTDAVHQADGEKMMQYFRKPGPDMSWMNALTSGNLVEQQAAMARMLAYTTKMVSAY